MPGSVSNWIRALKGGDQIAAQQLWERYHARLVGLAQQRLRHRRQSGDEEDVVQNTFSSFFHGMRGGRFPQLNDRHDLWRLLVVMTARKSIDHLRRESRGQNRDVTPASVSALYLIGTDSDAAFEEMVGQDPTPEMAAQLIEDYENLLCRLADDTLRLVAVWKLEGYNNSEIASKLECSRRTVIRKLETIRLIWSTEPEP